MKYRLRLPLLATVLAAPLLAPLAASAQDWPTKPIRLVVTFAAGGGADFAARNIGPALGEGLGQTVLVENRAGGGGLIGNDVVAKAAPDGYTLLLGAAGPLTVAPHLYENIPYDTLKDLAPVAHIASTPFVLVVNPDLPAKTVKELNALAKERPGKLTYGSSGTGGAPHLAGELYARLAEVNMVHAPYKGLAPAINDLLGGHIQVLFADTGLVAPHIAAGKLRALAVTGQNRSALLPDVPTVREAGLPDYQAGSWYGILAPAGTPKAVIDRVSAEVKKAVENPDVKQRLVKQGMEPQPASADQFARMLKSDYDRWGKLIKAANIKLK